MERLEPAHTIIRKLGGPEIVSRVLGLAITAPYRWQNPSEKGGSGGKIPARHIGSLLRHAEANGVDLTIEEFFGPPSSQKDEEAA